MAVIIQTSHDTEIPQPYYIFIRCCHGQMSNVFTTVQWCPSAEHNQHVPTVHFASTNFCDNWHGVRQWGHRSMVRSSGSSRQSLKVLQCWNLGHLLVQHLTRLTIPSIIFTFWLLTVCQDNRQSQIFAFKKMSARDKQFFDNWMCIGTC